MTIGRSNSFGHREGNEYYFKNKLKYEIFKATACPDIGECF